jgi:putative nucleotidyltransferase with HDIG domain
VNSAPQARAPLSPAQADAAAAGLFAASGSGHPVLGALRRLAQARLAEGRQAPPEPAPSPGGLHRPGPEVSAARATEAARQFLAEPSRRLKLPAPPLALERLQDMLADPETSARDMAGVISLDPRLAASLLRVVNSPLYSLPARVETVTRAVAILGQRQVSMLALAAALTGMFQDVRPDLLDPDRFWAHGLACAVLAHGLALAAGRTEPERHYLAGLLHDLGRLALHAVAPDLARQARELRLAHGLPEVEAERRVFEFDHGLLGAMIFTEWGLPHGVVAAAASHHDPAPGGSDTALVVHLANVAAVALGYGAGEGELVPPFSAWTWEALGLPVDRLVELAGGLDGMVAALAGGE